MPATLNHNDDEANISFEIQIGDYDKRPRVLVTKSIFQRFEVQENGVDEETDEEDKSDSSFVKSEIEEVIHMNGDIDSASE